MLNYGSAKCVLTKINQPLTSPKFCGRRRIIEHIFSPNGGYCVYYHASNNFRNTRDFENWGVSLGIFFFFFLMSVNNALFTS